VSQQSSRWGQELWKTSSSVYSIEFCKRPVLEDISLVIPTLGRAILEQSLYWIAVGSAWPGSLIIIEQGSNEEVDGLLQHFQSIGMHIKHIRSEQRGRSAGVNRGLEQVKTLFVAVTDDDCFVEEDWLLNMEKSLRKHPESIVTGRVEGAGEDTIIVVTSNTPAIIRRPRIKFDSMSGGNMGVSMSVVNRVGLFDEDPCMKTAEDAEWSYRALRKGVPIIYEPAVGVRHFGWRDPAKISEQYRQYARSHGGFYGKYIRKGDFFIFLRAIAHYFRALRRWVRGAVTQNAELALVGREYFFGLFPGIVEGFRSKFQVDQ
jgi:GT2 family glycosyltransferase